MYYHVLKPYHAFLVLVLLVSSLLGYVTVSPALVNVHARQVSVRDGVTAVHQTGFNKSAEVFGLRSSDFEIYVAIGNASNRFPLSLIILEKDYIGFARARDMNGTLHSGKIVVNRIISLSFPTVFLLNQSDSQNTHFNPQQMLSEVLWGKTWDTTVMRVGSLSYALDVRTRTKFGVVGFVFHVSLSEPRQEVITYLNVTADARTRDFHVNRLNKLMFLQSMNVKVDYYFSLNVTASYVFLPVDMKVLQLLDPLSSFLLRHQQVFQADMNIANKTDDTNPVARDTPINVKDVSGEPVKIKWVSTALVDGAEKNVRFYVLRKSISPMRLEWKDRRYVGTSISARGAYAYPFGNEIRHDPSLSTFIRFDEESVLVRSFLRPQLIGELVGLVFFTLSLGFLVSRKPLWLKVKS